MSRLARRGMLLLGMLRKQYDFFGGGNHIDLIATDDILDEARAASC